MRIWRTLAAAILLAAGLGAITPASAQEAISKPPASEVVTRSFRFFDFWNDPAYQGFEKWGLVVVLGVALAGLVYALALVGQVVGADQGTKKMQQVAEAIRKGANAYLARQFRAIILLVLIISGVLWASTEKQSAGGMVAIGRAAAFFVGAAFSWIVGFVGMSLAVRGNLRVAAAARTSYGSALQLGYRTGTITGMLTDGLGLLGGTLIFMMYGEHAYEVLLGFGFGGTLLALFMRVGGGIYTKAADVGADLVGKVEADIPEDDPRNAATIADNVGDNVGDCAGMAADIFESYEVTIVAAMILGYASFGHKGVIFPLLVRAIGVVGSIISTYTVKAGANSTSDEALHSVHRGFIIGSIISVVGFFALGVGYLHFDDTYVAKYPQALGGYEPSPDFAAARDKFEHDQASVRTADSAQICDGLQGLREELLRGQESDPRRSSAVLGEPRRQHARPPPRLDVPDRHHPGAGPEQGDELLHAHHVRAREIAGQGVPDGPRHEHHPGVRAGV